MLRVVRMAVSYAVLHIKIFANAAQSTLRAHAAQIRLFRSGLAVSFRRAIHERLLRKRTILPPSGADPVLAVRQRGLRNILRMEKRPKTY